MEFFQRYFDLIYKGICSLDVNLMEKAIDKILEANDKHRKVLIAGNGGSAAIASHVAVDMTKTAGIRAVNFNEAALLTCFSNDFGYEKVFEKSVEYYGDRDDVLILVSSSGRSPNMIFAAEKAKQLNLEIITFSGFNSDNPLRKLGDINFWVDSKSYNIVEMTHNIWLVAFIDFIIEKKITVQAKN